MQAVKKFLCVILALLAVSVCFAGCSGSEETDAGGTTAAADLSRFEHADLGVVTGSLFGGYSVERFPEASIDEYNNFADVLMALKQGKVDGIMLDRPNFNSVKRTENDLSCITVPEYAVEIGFGFQKSDEGNKLQRQMNSFLEELGETEKLDELLEKWYGEEEPNVSVPLGELADNTTPLNVFSTPRANPLSIATTTSRWVLRSKFYISSAKNTTTTSRRMTSPSHRDLRGLRRESTISSAGDCI